MKIPLIKIITILFFILIQDVYADAYFVDPDGSDGNSGEIEAPFKTIQKAVDVVNPGDTIIVNKGEYRDDNNDNWVVKIDVSGTENEWITIKSKNKHEAKILGDQETGYGIVFLQNAKYIKLIGFDISGMNNGGVWGYKASNIVVSNNRIHHNGNNRVEDCTDSYGRVGVYTNPFTESFIFKDNVIYNNGRSPNVDCDELPTSENHNYRHDHGMYLQGKYHLIEGNILFGHNAGYAIKVDGHVQEKADELYPYTHVIINNTFGKQMRTDVHSGGVIRMFNNMTYIEGYGNLLSPVVLIQNNLFYKPGGIASDTAIRITKNINSNFPGTVIKNNITTSKYLYSENLGSEITGNIDSSGNLTLKEMFFVNPEDHNYTLEVNSPAVDNYITPGFDMNVYDINYVERKNNGAVDLY